MMKKREILVEGLKNNLVKVVFTKVNGDERTMNCTLHDSVLPEPNITETKKKVNPDTISVWDVDNGGWRSFRLDSIKEFRIVEGMKELI
ncbi:MAG: DUF2693 domain-containing protein [Gammaproteobacteria bacterium]|jgi:hypothetical protein|nr:DUF2693 domain-containing protein [Gammaproteobacteria bacterium]